MTAFTFVLFLYLLWTPAALAAAFVRFKGYWSPGTILGTGVTRAAEILQALLSVIPAVAAYLFFLVYYRNFHISYSAGSWSPLAAALFSLGPQLLLGTAIGWKTAAAERKAAGDPHPQNLRRARRVHVRRQIAIPSILLALVAITGPAVLGALVLIAIGVRVIRTVLTSVGRYLPGDGFEMEETPLRTEIVEIAAAFGVNVKRLMVRPEKRRTSSLEAPLLEPLRRGATSDVREDRAIPLNHFLELDPEVLTAALAHRWARTATTGSFYGSVDTGPIVRGIMNLFAAGFGCFGFWMLLILGYSLITALADLSLLRPVAPVLYVVYTLVLIIMIPYLILRTLGGLPTGYEAHHNAFTAWRAADHAGSRYMADYAAALARYLATSRAIRNVEIVLLQLRRDRGLLSFLETGPPGTTEVAFDMARTAVLRDLETDEARHVQSGQQLALSTPSSGEPASNPEV